MYCLGTVSWNGYIERYIDIFATNYIRLYRRLIAFGVNYKDIADPLIYYMNDEIGPVAKEAIKRIEIATGKKLQFIQDKDGYSVEKVMYTTRNGLRNAFRKLYPKEKKVFFYFPIDDNIRIEAALELIKLHKATEPTACMFKFLVEEPKDRYTAATRPINSYKDIHHGDWGGYCAYNILNENECPLYPSIDIPNIAFYANLYKAGYKEYQSKEICVDHLRHLDSHHYKYKNTAMAKRVKNYLDAQINELREKGYK